MSGISGIYNLDGCPVDPFALKRMAEAIAHRGPDGVCRWINGQIGFAHLRNNTTPEALYERQPLGNEDGSCWLTMDGRIDNGAELRKALESRGRRCRDTTDAEVVLRAYEQWREDCPRRLLGDFAFAIWDSRQRHLFCARDHVGVRPFYYYRGASRFAFGSEIRALLALDSIRRRLNESRLVDFLVEELDWTDTESTFYRGILRLPAGHRLTVGPNRFEIRNYWELSAPPTLELGSVEEYGEAFRSVFVEGVRCRLRSAKRVGATLSGGLDSSSVVCTVRELLASELKEPLCTISLVDADESKCGETPYIREVLRGGWIIPNVVRSDHPSELEDAMIGADEPFEIGRYFPNWFGFAAARNAGAAVLLDGAAGDHINAPEAYLAALIHSMEWKTLRAEIAHAWGGYRDGLKALAYCGLAPIAANLYQALRWLIHWRTEPRVPKNALIDPDFALRERVSKRLALGQRQAWKLAADIGELHAASFSSGILPFFFEQCGRVASSLGIEPRHPFADRRIVDFFLSLPLKMKLYVPMPKIVIRAGMKGILPELVRWRTRYAHPGAAFLSSQLTQQRRLLEPKTFAQMLEPLRKYVNFRLADQARQRALLGSVEDAWPVWQVLNLAVWMNSRNW